MIRSLLGMLCAMASIVALWGPGTKLVCWAAGPTQQAPPPQFDRDVLDAFFDDARQELGPGEPGRSAAAAAAAANSGTGTEETTGAKTGAWSQLISPDALESEVKSTVGPAAEAVKNLSFFKGEGHNIARNTYTDLAVVFAVISQYDGDVRWKRDAVGLRHKFLDMAANCKTSSDATYNQAKLRSQDLAELVRGQSIELPPNADPEMPLGKNIFRPSVMARMEAARNERLGPWTANAGTFAKNKDDLLHEAQMMAMLAKYIQDPAFEFADDEGYQGYAKQLEEQAKALIDAIKLDNQPGASSAVSQINKACDACHGEYR